MNEARNDEMNEARNDEKEVENAGNHLSK